MQLDKNTNTNVMIAVVLKRKMWLKLRKFEGIFKVLWLILAFYWKIIWGNDMFYATVTESLLDEKMYEAKIKFVTKRINAQIK